MFLDSLAGVVAEAVGDWFQHRKGSHIGLSLRSIGATRFEWNLDVVSSFLGSGLDGRATGESDQVGERDFLAAFLRSVEVLLDGFELR